MLKFGGFNSAFKTSKITTSISFENFCLSSDYVISSMGNVFKYIVLKFKWKKFLKKMSWPLQNKKLKHKLSSKVVSTSNVLWSTQRKELYQNQFFYKIKFSFFII